MPQAVDLDVLPEEVRFWNDHFYVGTFSEHDMGAIRAGAYRRDPHGLARG